MQKKRDGRSDPFLEATRIKIGHSLTVVWADKEAKGASDEPTPTPTPRGFHIPPIKGIHPDPTWSEY